MATPTADKDVFAFEQFLGLRNVVVEENFDPGDLVVARNVDVTDDKRLRRRAGHGAPVFTSAAHSVWSDGDMALFVSGSDLYRLYPDYTFEVVRGGLTLDRRMYYTAVADRVYFSNGVESGVYTPAGARTWGLARPIAQPTATVIGGTLPAGTYQYAVTFLRDDGQESGTGIAGTVELLVAGGLQFDLIAVSTDTHVIAKRLYVSPPNGAHLYQQAVLAAAEETATYTAPVIGTLVLATQFLSAPPPGQHLGYFAGRTLVAAGNRLYVSEPYAPELFDLRRSYPFTGRISLVAPVEDGVYLGTEGQIVWLPGKDPATWVHQPRASYGAIAGTLAYGNAEDVGEGLTGPAAYFATAEGLCVGLNGGSFRNLTNGRFVYPATKEGAGVVRGSRGSNQYVTTLRGVGEAGNTAF